jgi:ribosomal protein S18 acetylase RimI-like enzyme
MPSRTVTDVQLDLVTEETVPVLQYQEGRFAFLAQFEGASIGEICFRWGAVHGRPVLYISSLSVRKAYRGSGVSEQLLRHGITECPSAMAFFLHVHVSNTATIRLYEKRRLVVVDRVHLYYGDEDRFVMRAGRVQDTF